MKSSAPHSHRNAIKTHCIRGHAFDEANTYIETKQDGSITRRCRACRKVTKDRYFYEVTRPKRYKGLIEYHKGEEIFSVWRSMMGRCRNKSDNRYGGRGISVCDRWKRYNNFYDDMLPNYKKGLTLDRINNNGDYSPENCRWTTPKDQANNRSNNRMITYKGLTKTLQQWADYIGIQSATLRYRLNNWCNVERCLTTPLTNRENY